MPDGVEALSLPAGYRLFSFESLDSTNAEALRRLAAGGGAGEVIWARSQQAGRGRRGATWQSLEGNLYMSLTVAAPDTRSAGQLAFVAALGAGEAIRPALPAGHSLRYKWPNDLMLDGEKLGGILIEGADNPGAAGLFAVGIGINVEHAPDNLGAACLARAGVDLTPAGLLQAVCHRFDAWLRLWQSQGFEPLRQAWLAHAHRLDAPVEARFPDGRRSQGLFRDIDETGALVLRHEDGATERIATGEVFFPAA